MPTTQLLDQIIQELAQTARVVADADVDKLAEEILRSRKVFVAGAGRSGLMMRAFAMRLMQLGIDAYVVGETVTPNLDQGDLLLIGSGSGETKSLIPMAEKARSLGGTVAVITISPESAIGRLSTLIIKLPGAAKDHSGGQSSITIQPMGALFEQTLLLFGDTVILKMMEKQGLNTKAMFGRHANLE
ncbi:6-phospho-3-hexuloisomerase [Paenibacillus solisilvae]|uniref:6-phospho-3-hexuloisomerase n=1 Tax=Paenibacillus solisilvae TaxID=2486751 RepID=A0ABW0W3H9_9BACL